MELDYRITSDFYEQMKPFLTKELRAVSIHNYFPLPEEIPPSRASGDLFLLPCPDRDERWKAVEYSTRTIAHDLGARAVVLHLSRVDMPKSDRGLFCNHQRQRYWKFTPRLRGRRYSRR